MSGNGSASADAADGTAGTVGGEAAADAAPAEGDAADEGDGVVIDLGADHRDPPPLRALEGVERRVLLLDAGFGLLVLAVGLLSRPDGALAARWWLALLAGGLTAALMLGDERNVLGRFEGYEAGHRRAALAVAALALLAATLLATLLAGAVAAASVALVGVGVGVLAYRTAFGVLLPIPRPRIRRAQHLRWIVADVTAEVGERVRG